MPVTAKKKTSKTTSAVTEELLKKPSSGRISTRETASGRFVTKAAPVRKSRAQVNESKPLLVHFSSREAVYGVTRTTVKRLQSTLGLPTETSVIHYALAALRNTAIPAYEPDDGPVPEAMLLHIRSTIDQEIVGGTALFDGL